MNGGACVSKVIGQYGPIKEDTLQFWIFCLRIIMNFDKTTSKFLILYKL